MLNGLNVTTAAIIADAAVLCVIAIYAIKSWKKGFVNCIVAFVSGIAALFLAIILAAPMLKATNGWFGLQETITNAIVNMFSKMAGFTIDVSSASLELLMEGKMLPAFIKNAVISVGVEGVPQGTTLAMLVGGKIGEFATTLVSFALMYLILKIGMKIIQRVLGGVIPALPVIGKVDGWLGLLLGLVEGFLLVSVVVAVFAILPFGSTAQFFEQSLLLKWLYNKNIVHVIFSWFLS